MLDGIEYVRGDDGYIVAGKDDSLSSLQIPAYVNGLPVTAVAAGAFTKDSSLREVVLPDTVREVGEENGSITFAADNGGATYTVAYDDTNNIITTMNITMTRVFGASR